LGVNFHSCQDYSIIKNDKVTIEDDDLEMSETKLPQAADLSEMGRFPVQQIWTFNVLTILLAQAIFDFHMG
jgi:hypothetical protein